MNKFFLFFCILVFGALQAQPVRLNTFSSGYLAVRSYQGLTLNNVINMQIHLQNSNGNQLNVWSLSYRVLGNITNGTKTFPPEKIKLRFNNLTGSGGNPPGNITPTPANIGLNTNPLPLSLGTSYLLSNSTYSLEHNGYYQLSLLYDMLVEGGAYLQQYSSWAEYRVNVLVELRNRKGELISSMPFSINMQVHPDDALPTQPTYGITFEPAAKNVLLEFKTPSDYANGVSKTFSKAFSTISSTGYVVNVSTLSNQLASSSNRTLPAEAINLTVRNNASQALFGSTNLSVAKRTVVSSPAHTAARFYDTTYATQAGDTRFFNQSYGQYSGTLIFEIVPQ